MLEGSVRIAALSIASTTLLVALVCRVVLHGYCLYVCGRVGIPFTLLCRKWDLRIRYGLWTRYSVIGIGERVATEDQIDWRIVFVHDGLHEDHA